MRKPCLKSYRDSPRSSPRVAMASSGGAKPRSMWWQAGPFEQWVQEVLISVLVPEGASVCELMCGSGKALGKWQRAKLTQYVGIGEGTAHSPPVACRAPLNHALNPARSDAQEHAIKEAKQRWTARGKSFPARFCVIDPYLVRAPSDPTPPAPHHRPLSCPPLTLGCVQRPVQDILEPERRFNAVACFGKLQACFAREATARTLIANAAARLNEGGYFFGFLPDSSHIWCVPSRPAAHCGRESASHLPAAHQDEGAGAAARECWELRTRRR